MNASVLDRVRQLTADVFGVEVGGVTAASSPETIASWDSQAHLNFVLALEAEFGIRLSAVAVADILNVGLAVSAVEEQLAKHPA
jgi:acyl carrier protein